MSERQRFIRKIVYACAIAALLLPLSWLSAPATTESDGGVLAQMRKENHLSQATLGEIDPASETIKLATLGMRGVAANILWEKAHEYRKNEDWVGLSATLEQIAKLQPNFISVWVYQGWNLSYNISVEFDDYRDRYYWVIRGINFLKEGTGYNAKEPRLTSEVGWTIAQKIGRADEHLQYRKLFREDDDFHGARPRAQRDNWLVGREYLQEAQRWVDQEGLTVKGKSPLLFHSHPVMCLINYCEALEEEGTFGEVAKSAWRKAADSWNQFANRDLPTQHSFFIRLADKEEYDKRAQNAIAELERLTPKGLREQIQAEKLATLTDEERAAYEALPADRTAEQNALMYGVDAKLKIAHPEVAARITGADRAAALKAAEEATQAEFMSETIDIERGIVNFDYWRKRCEIEPQDVTLDARKKIYDADQAFTGAQIVEARDLYNAGWQKWREVLDANKFLIETPSLVEELSFSIGNYVALMHQLDEKLPEPFVLQDVMDANEQFTGRAFPGAPPSSDDAAAAEPGKDDAAAAAAESDAPAAAGEPGGTPSEPTGEANPAAAPPAEPKPPVEPDAPATAPEPSATP
ncbi:MAG: hypothetical protein AB7O59_17960 [Pirellulales bacterium]